MGWEESYAELLHSGANSPFVLGSRQGTRQKFFPVLPHYSGGFPPAADQAPRRRPARGGRAAELVSLRAPRRRAAEPSRRRAGGGSGAPLRAPAGARRPLRLRSSPLGPRRRAADPSRRRTGAGRWRGEGCAPWMWLDPGRAWEKNKGVFVYCPVCFHVSSRTFLHQELLYFGLCSSDHFQCSPPEVPWCRRGLPAAPGLSGLPCLFIRVTTPCAGSVSWACTNLCFPNTGIKRRLGLFERQLVNPGGGQSFPCLLVLPSRCAAALSCLSARWAKRP